MSSLLAIFAFGAAMFGFSAPSSAEVTTVKGSACGHYVNVGLFGGPQQLRGCDQAGISPTDPSYSPKVTLPEGGSAEPITATDPDGAVAQYGPARIFSGKWPEHVSSAPPSGPITVSTQGTTGADGSVTSSVDIVLRDPPNTDSPGGFGPGPVEGDELHSTCTATESGVTGSTRFVNALLSTTTDVEGSPLDQEAIPDNPPVNYTRSGVITNVGDVFTVVFNEQIVNPDGSLTVNAFHMYLFGPVAVGESVGGQVTCGTTPTTASPNDTVAPSCGMLVVKPTGPEDPTPLVPRQELIGVFDTGGLQSISNIQVTNGTVEVGNPEGQPYLRFSPGQTGPLPVTATRSEEAEAAGLPLTWSFDATDVAGNTRSSAECPTDSERTITPVSAGGGGSGSDSGSGSGSTDTTTAPTATTRAASATATTAPPAATRAASASATATTVRAATGTTRPAAQSGSGSTSAGRSVAKTGIEVRPLMIAGLAMVSIGAAAVLGARRPVAQGEHPPARRS